MSKRETQMTQRFWKRASGTLIEEFLAVPGIHGRVGRRMIDGVIVKDGKHRIAERGEKVSLAGRDV